jgi:hypothetical protein
MKPFGNVNSTRVNLQRNPVATIKFAILDPNQMQPDGIQEVRNLYLQYHWGRILLEKKKKQNR